MKIGILVKIDRDEAGGMSDPVVRAFTSKAAAQDEMIADFAKVKAARYPKEESVFDDLCDADEAYIAGTDDSEVNWRVYETEVEGWR